MDKIIELFGGIYKGKKVFITGHTGFKGSWLALWLVKMGAIVKGYSLAPNTSPSHWDLLNIDMESIYADIRDRDRLEKEILNFSPDIIFHLAAQPIVRLSYEQPYETYDINVMGTLALFEASRKVDSIKAIINVTSDKCYDNKEWVYGYRENDAMGGYDPYSSSKGASEILTASYRNSYWNKVDYGRGHNVLLASCRAGNVIGGGDWAQDRLIPDIMKATSKGENVYIRNPKATRPWQHVLEPLSGYLVLGQKLLEGQKKYADAWNFGPNDEETITVKEVSEYIKDNWADVSVTFGKENKSLHEANLLKLDCSKVKQYLNWHPVWNTEVFEKTASWYRTYYTHGRILTEEQLISYIKKAFERKMVWVD